MKSLVLRKREGAPARRSRGGSVLRIGRKRRQRQRVVWGKRSGWPLPIHQLLSKHGVQIVFHGHDHFYVKEELDGMVYQAVPQPGHPRYDNTRSADEYGYKSGVIQGSSGHLRVVVQPDKATISYVRSYLPAVETAERRNAAVSHTYEVAPFTKISN